MKSLFDEEPATDYDIRFEAWWRLYPQKVGKRAAEKSWEKACQRLEKRFGSVLEARAYLLDRVRAFAESDKGRGQFVPHPTTWLNQGRYDDDDAAWRNAVTSSQADEIRKFLEGGE